MLQFRSAGDTSGLPGFNGRERKGRSRPRDNGDVGSAGWREGSGAERGAPQVCWLSSDGCGGLWRVVTMRGLIRSALQFYPGFSYLSSYVHIVPVPTRMIRTYAYIGQAGPEAGPGLPKLGAVLALRTDKRINFLSEVTKITAILSAAKSPHC